MHNTVEIRVRPPGGETIRHEFERFLTTAGERGWGELKVMFRFAWGNDVYEQDWLEETMSPDELKHKVREAEEAGFGSISDDNLHVTVVELGVDFTFCHENDIHISHTSDSPFIRDEIARYLELGWCVFERIRNESGHLNWNPINRVEDAAGFH